MNRDHKGTGIWCDPSAPFFPTLIYETYFSLWACKAGDVSWCILVPRPKNSFNFNQQQQLKTWILTYSLLASSASSAAVSSHAIHACFVPHIMKRRRFFPTSIRQMTSLREAGRRCDGKRRGAMQSCFCQWSNPEMQLTGLPLTCS